MISTLLMTTGILCVSLVGGVIGSHIKIKPTPKDDGPVLEPEMVEILTENGYVPLNKWREKNDR